MGGETSYTLTHCNDYVSVSAGNEIYIGIPSKSECCHTIETATDVSVCMAVGTKQCRK